MLLTGQKISSFITTSLLASLTFSVGCLEASQPIIPAELAQMSEIVETSDTAEIRLATEKPFLETVVGHWKGSCDIVAPGSPELLFEVEMERIVEPTDDPNRYTWQIIYRTPDSEQIRDYSMIIVDEEAGHYQVDENNGIVIDMYYYTPGILTQAFDVGNVRIIGHETYKGRRLNLQLIASGLEPATISGTEDFVVSSYPFFTNQYCQLKKKRNRR